MKGPRLDMMETDRHARLEKRERLLDIFDSRFVIGIYSTINNITGFILIWRLRVLVSLDRLG
jgi:hypothetical protein